MSWQDLVLTIGSLIFSLALLPTIFSKHAAPTWTTSGVTAAVLLTYVVVYATLHLWFSATATALNGFLWLVLLVKARRRQYEM